MSTLALKASGLCKRYGAVRAVEEVSFQVQHGEIVGLLGPNGAGKTTTINMVLGVLQPSAGGIQIEGIDIGRQRSQALAHTNFAAVYATLPGNLTVWQNLRFFGLLYDVAELNARIETLLAELDLLPLRQYALRSAFLGRADAAGAGQGAAQLTTPAAARRAHGLARSFRRRPDPPAHSRAGGAAALRHPLDLAQHVRGGGNLSTACCSYRMAGSCSRAIRVNLPQQHGTASLEELFIRLAREPLAAGRNA